MNTVKSNFKSALLILFALILFSYACTEVEDETRAAILLTVSSVTGEPGGPGEEAGAPLLSDVCDSTVEQNPNQDPEFCTVFNDNATFELDNQFLQVGPGSGVGSPSYLNDVIVNRYRVDYFRPNSRNTPGIDVPFGIDGVMNVRVDVNSTANGTILVVRHEAKREPPLAELANGPSEGVLTLEAQLKFFGQDIAGRNVTATGFLEIHFANFGEGL